MGIRGVPKGISLVKFKSVLSKYVKNVKSVKFVRSDGTNENKNDLQKIIETKLNLKSDAELLLNLKGIAVNIGGTTVDLIFFKPRNMHQEEQKENIEKEHITENIENKTP